MNVRGSLLASAIVLSCAAAPVAAQQTLAADAKAFGVREAVDWPDLSADGNRIMMWIEADHRLINYEYFRVM